MQLIDFDYNLPKELIAQEPLAKRDTSRLLVVSRADKKIFHRNFKDFPEYLDKKDLVVFNNTKVTPARLLGHKKDTLGKVDALLVRKISTKRFNVLIRPPLKIGQRIIFGSNTAATLVDRQVLEFDKPFTRITQGKIGVMPLPPYIKRLPAAADQVRYQTVYAKTIGAIAAPTAGLHFTEKILDAIKKKQADIRFVTLHTGLGTFKPVKSEDVGEHQMEEEEFIVPATTIKAVSLVKKNNTRVFAVGTTSLRALESAAKLIAEPRVPPVRPGGIPESRGFTDLFVLPGYKFKVVDCLLTNFHLPKTTLFMLVCALAGRDLIRQAYQEAIKEKYRFYSYGDAMLII